MDKVWRDQRVKWEGVSKEVEKIQWPKVWRDQRGKWGVKKLRKYNGQKFEETNQVN
jgi:hypothetical protein